MKRYSLSKWIGVKERGDEFEASFRGRTYMPASPLINFKSERYSPHNAARVVAMAISPIRSSRGGLLDKPVIEKTNPGRQSEFDVKKKKKNAPPYRVILYNDNFNKREYVVKVLLKVIPGMTLETAVSVMQEAHRNGLSVVIICGQSDAEEHCMQLRNNGLRSSIEPASGGC